VLTAYREGDFEAALKATEGLRKEAEQYCFLRGGLLMELGNLDEAEKLLQQSVTLSEQRETAIRSGNTEEIAALEKHTKLCAFRWALLGELDLERGRYNKAMQCFETSLRKWPGYGSFHRAIAETWLRRGDDPTEALKWATLAVKETRAAKASSLGEDLATLAWAVAVASQDRAKVDRLVSEAISLVGTQSVTSRAQVNYHSGLAYTELGDSELGAVHLKEAAAGDRLGRWGRAARLRVGTS
jgi:tetratricopeptide (TPR) repeat protein